MHHCALVDDRPLQPILKGSTAMKKTQCFSHKPTGHQILPGVFGEFTLELLTSSGLTLQIPVGMNDKNNLSGNDSVSDTNQTLAAKLQDVSLIRGD